MGYRSVQACIKLAMSHRSSRDWGLPTEALGSQPCLALAADLLLLIAVAQQFVEQIVDAGSLDHGPCQCPSASQLTVIDYDDVMTRT